MSAVETWVNDKLHDILGISDKYIAQYLIGLAKKSSSAEEYVEKLRDTGTVEIDQSMVTFSQELWNKASTSSSCFSTTASTCTALNGNGSLA